MDVLEHVSRALGATPRRFGWLDRLTYLRVRRPHWADNDDLRRWFEGFPRLLKHGRVTWGRIIQANALLFSAGDDNCPGEVIHTTEAAAYSSPSLLEPISEALYALKGTTPDDPELARIAHYLTDQRIRVFGWPVPRGLSGGTPCRISTIFFPRQHLPNRILSLSHFPLLVSPGDDGLAAVAPSRYWPEAFTSHWLQAEERDATESSATDS